MKYQHIRHSFIAAFCVLVCVAGTGCKKNNGSVWDDNPHTGNYKGNTRSLWGNDDIAQEESFFNPSDEDFVALKDEDLQAQFTDGAIPQPKQTPGEKGSIVPGIEGFHSPTGQEAVIFKSVYFKTDDHILRGQEYTAIIDRVVTYLKTHPDVYLFITGNCDERAPEAYNLALGARRANYVRTLLVQKGVEAERVHTVSYGKERPVAFGHNEESWSKNRRAEFKIYHKNK